MFSPAWSLWQRLTYPGENAFTLAAPKGHVWAWGRCLVLLPRAAGELAYGASSAPVFIPHVKLLKTP